MKQKLTTLLFSLSLLVVTGCREFYDYFNDVEPEILKVREYATGLATPLGLYLDAKEQLWVTEVGSGNNDGKVSVIMPNGTKHVVIEGFPSFMGPGGSEEIVGVNHLLLKNGMLYILHTNGLLYKANISSFDPEDAPLQASALATENIAAFVLNYDFDEDVVESNPYNLTLGPNGDLYITDAAANAVIRRSSNGQLSVFATFPDIANPIPVGPPTIDFVPTSIAFNGQNFYVTSLTGFPFPTGKARIYSVNLAGKISLYQEGFSTITDMTFDPVNNPVVVEYAQFTLEGGYNPNTGRIVVAAQDGQSTLVSGINLPTAIVRSGLLTYYVNSLADGKIFKVTAQ